MKLNSLGSPLLLLLIAAIAIGWLGGVTRTTHVICGDISFYYGNDKDLIKIRSCEGN